MSVIEELLISGFRSYSDETFVKLKFQQPLTLIWGKNGAGKTAIVECLRFIICNEAPPNSDRGRLFVMDPQIAGKAVVTGQIRLRFRMKEVRFEALKVSKVSAKSKQSCKKGLQFQSVEHALKTTDSEGKIISINQQCSEMEKVIPSLMGVRKHIIQKIILCHQEEALWPFQANQELKAIFDELFDTTQIVKMLEGISSAIKALQNEVKDTRKDIAAETRLLDMKLKQRKEKCNKVKDLATLGAQISRLSQKVSNFQGLEEVDPDNDSLSKLDELHNILRSIQLELSRMNVEVPDPRYSSLSQEQIESRLESNRRLLQKLVEKRERLLEGARRQDLWRERMAMQQQEYASMKAQIEVALKTKLKDNGLKQILQRLEAEVVAREKDWKNLGKLKRQLYRYEETNRMRSVEMGLREQREVLGKRLIGLRAELVQLVSYMEPRLAGLQSALQHQRGCLPNLGLSRQQSQSIIKEYNQLKNQLSEAQLQSQKFKYTKIELQRGILEYIKKQKRCAFCNKAQDPAEAETKVQKTISSSLGRVEENERQVRALSTKLARLSPKKNLAVAVGVLFGKEEERNKSKAGFDSQQLPRIRTTCINIRSMLTEAKTIVGEQGVQPVNFKYEMAEELQRQGPQLYKILQAYKESNTRLIGVKESLKQLAPEEVREAMGENQLKQEIKRIQGNKYEELRSLCQRFQQKVKVIEQLLKERPQGYEGNEDELLLEMRRVQKQIEVLEIVGRASGTRADELLGKQARVKREIDKLTAIRKNQLQRKKERQLQMELRTKIDRVKYMREEVSEESLKDSLMQLARLQSELAAKEKMLFDLKAYEKGVESALLEYHREKLEEVNKIIEDLWGEVYTAKDIAKIQIKSESNEGRKNYQYRLVLFTPKGHELDMKGRCSMGQKVLASIIVRMALAEAFGSSCGIFALDEPTTNLDEEHVAMLAQQLNRLIELRKEVSSFQLIVITHDPEFVRMLSQHAEEGYFVFKSKSNFSEVELRRLKH